MHWQVLFGLALGIGLGFINGSVGAYSGARVDGIIYDLIGSLFLNGLKMMVVPLVVVSIISAIGTLGDQQGFARLGFKTLAYYVCTSFIAIMIGLVLVNAIQPGSGAGDVDFAALTATEDSVEQEKLATLHAKTEGRTVSDTLNVLKELVPSNIFAAAADMKMLGLIVFSLLFGFYLNKQPEMVQARPPCANFGRHSMTLF